MRKREVLEDQFKTWDNTELFYRTWKPVSDQQSNKAMIVLHRGHEHSGRLHDIIDRLDLPDFWAFGYDCRGHGKSPGPRGYADDFSILVKDLDSFVRYVSKKHNIPVENMVIVANSVAAVVTSTWVHDYAPNIRAMILAAPAFRIKLYVPFALPALRILNRLKKPSFISSYVKARFLTHDAEKVKEYEGDKLITSEIAVNILISLHDTATRIINDAGAIVVPTCILSAGADWVVKNAPQWQFFNKLASSKKEMHTYPGFFHGIFFEEDRIKPLTKAREFILACFEEDIQIPSLLDADKKGYTKAEYDQLCKPKPPIKQMMNGVQKLGMTTFGRLSHGIRIGYASGFDSGLSLDYVYKNKATGFTPLGKIIDYFYINAIGWRGIRQRKVNMQQSLDEVIEQLLAEERPIRILDIAAGPGRYLIETAEKLKGKDIRVYIRDNEIENINEGKKIAKEMGLKNVEFKVADAFDKKSYSSEEFSVNVLIISGLYELFSDNDMIKNSLEGAVSILQDGGYIVYTGQPWHPQLEMIANLPNRDGQQWIMRRRTQRELDQLISSVGYQKTEMKIDQWGIFTVSIAKNSTCAVRSSNNTRRAEGLGGVPSISPLPCAVTAQVEKSILQQGFEHA